MLSLNCKHLQHVKICLPFNFEVNPVTHFGVFFDEKRVITPK
jgi:hypothetical protein